MSIMEYNGSAVMAMKGKNCVAIAADRRFGVQLMTLSTDFQKIFEINPRTYIGLPGLATDVQTLSELFRFKTNLYKLREERDISPKTFSHMVSSTLYEKRFGNYFCEPVIAGIEKDGSPYICSMDLLGCINHAKDFVVSGTASSQMYGTAEGLWEPELEPEELFETIAQAMMSAVDRDASSGWGVIVHVITADGVMTKTLKARMD
ncbi:nucleophile aminohydrolase [Geranomyces variabilis]|nr:nucleophile aminohydrolase [Geranomyces variabilis]